MTAFDPAAWLRSFEAVGGWYVITGDRPFFGWRVDGDDQERMARELWNEVRLIAEHRQAITALVRSRCLIA